jgi:hypothetical protein
MEKRTAINERGERVPREGFMNGFSKRSAVEGRCRLLRSSMAITAADTGSPNPL